MASTESAAAKTPRRVFWTRALILLTTPLAVLPAARAEEPPALRPEGVTPQVEASIERGLQFLARHQQADGSFGKSRWDPGEYTTAMTALAGLAFLASGSTPSQGPYAKHLDKLTSYLLRMATDHPVDGLLSNWRADEARPMYCHAFTMTYLAQVLGHETDKAQRERMQIALRRAVECTRRAQSEDGGWGYAPNYWEDEGTLTVTQLQALRACRDAGISVPKAVVDGGVQFIERSANPDGSVRYRVRASQYNTRPGVTCAALVALWNAGRYDDPLVKRIAACINRSVRVDWDSGHHAEYVLYYLAQAKFVLGGKEWRSFYPEAVKLLTSRQSGEGSWDGADGGEIYSTTIALLVLELPYNRLPVFQR